MNGEALINDVTSPNSSEWRREINRMAGEFNIKCLYYQRASLKSTYKIKIQNKVLDLIKNENVEKTKIKKPH